LKDNLDLEDFDVSWLLHFSNAKFLKGANLAFLQYIQAIVKLWILFLINKKDGNKILCFKAMAIYEIMV
jgi:hypothetical protein